MPYGLSIGGFAFTYGALSVVKKGTITAGTTVYFNKGAYPDISDFRAVFVPTGVRNITAGEVRPYFNQSVYGVLLTSPDDAGPHNYLVLGR